METTEKTMHPKVVEFIENAKKAQAEEAKKEKEKLLSSLGLLYTTTKKYIDYEERFNYPDFFWDTKAERWCVETKEDAISVTDEEFEEIKKYAKLQTSENVNHTINNGAENFLNTINVLSLIVTIIAAVILIIKGFSDYELHLTLIGIVILFVDLIYYSFLKVFLNISNNLHKINAKLK